MTKSLSSIILLFSLAVLLSSCSNTFKVSGEIEGLGNQDVRIVYATDAGVKDVWVQAKDGKFTFKGSSSELTVAGIFDNTQQLIAHVAVKNGDNIKITGNITAPLKLTVSGSDIDEEWYAFINKNAGKYTPDNAAMLNAAIEKYIKENPKSTVSTLLLMVDYNALNNHAKVEKLLASIDEDARPQSLLKTYSAMKQQLGAPANRLQNLMLYSIKGDFDTFIPMTSPYNLLFFWTDDMADRPASVKALRELAKKCGKRLQIADIDLEADTTIWRTTIKSDSSTWKHFWAPGGPVYSDLKNLCIDSTPLYIVVDSTGTQLYRGDMVLNACQVIESKIH
jgi:hypothetical protein